MLKILQPPSQGNRPSSQMPSFPWCLALTACLGAGPLTALDLPWNWMGLDDVGGPSVSDSAAPGPQASWEKGGETHSETREGYAHVWGHSVFHFDVSSWFGPAWFSTPLKPGSLSSSGGWGLYFLDSFGVLTCGEFWPWIAWGVLGLLAITLSVLGLYVVASVCRPFRLLCKCCCRQTRAVAQEVGEFLPELQVGGSYEALRLRGPHTRDGVDSEFFQRSVKGRGSERKPNDVVVLLDEQAARLRPDCDHWPRVDRHGLLGPLARSERCIVPLIEAKAGAGRSDPLM